MHWFCIALCGIPISVVAVSFNKLLEMGTPQLHASTEMPDLHNMSL